LIASYRSEYKINGTTTAIDRISAVVAPESVNNTSSTNSVINLAGDEYDSFVTDNSFRIKPFPGPPNPDSLFGNYQNGILPFDGTQENPDAVYLSGLEYIMGKYHLGGKYSCLSALNNKKCPDDPKLCVLTRLLNTNIVRCSVFMSKSIQHGFVRCTNSQTSDCTQIDSMNRIGGGTIAIRSCDDGIKCYDGNNDLCEVSKKVADRIDPSPSLGTTLSEDQYYDSSSSSGYSSAPKGASSEYDANLYALRDKTSLELGMCVGLPQGMCPARTNYSAANRYAYWPSTPAEQIAQGVCKPGYVRSGQLRRRCLVSPETQTYAFGPITGTCVVPTLQQKSNGNYIINEAARDLGIDVTIAKVAGGAWWENSVGSYFISNTGNPIRGTVMIGNTLASGINGQNFTTYYAPGSIPSNAEEIGFFLIPDGYDYKTNNKLANNTRVWFSIFDNPWRARRISDSQVIHGRDRWAFFSHRPSNPANTQQSRYTSATKRLGWKDRDDGSGTSNFDDVILRIDAKIRQP
jgi:hypothetical protein